MQEITLRTPDDWHIHLRDGELLQQTVPDAARQFGRAIVMPNLVPPVRNSTQAAAYRDRILAEVPQGLSFEPLMVLYLTDSTTAADIHEAHKSGFVKAVKLYPAGATTNSDSGVTNLHLLDNTFAAMQEAGIPLLVHGEVTDSDIDIFDREAVFIERVLKPLTARFPTLKIVLEHITTAEAVAFVSSAPANIGATITAHHLLFNRNDMLAGGIRPHFYCLPILKRQQHQQALVKAATSGNPKFFLGTDSAPHAVEKKEAACGCAGCYTAPVAIELYAEAFEQAGALHRLEDFASSFGADFYGLPRSTTTITLHKSGQRIPELLPFGSSRIKPMKAGEEISWRLATGK